MHFRTSRGSGGSSRSEKKKEAGVQIAGLLSFWLFKFRYCQFHPQTLFSLSLSLSLSLKHPTTTTVARWPTHFTLTSSNQQHGELLGILASTMVCGYGTHSYAYVKVNHGRLCLRQSSTAAFVSNPLIFSLFTVRDIWWTPFQRSQPLLSICKC